MVIMSLDYGDARTGVAFSDPGEFLATGVTVIAERTMTVVAERAAALAKEHKAEQIVLGLPRNMDGTEGFRAEKTRRFGTYLEELTGLPVVYWDERNTTVSAHLIMNMTDTRGAKRKKSVDRLAAEIILQSYLDSPRKQ